MDECKIVYNKKDEHPGNDCWITDIQLVIEISDTFYLANKITLYSGWMGHQRDVDTKEFDNKEDAIRWTQDK